MTDIPILGQPQGQMERKTFGPPYIRLLHCHTCGTIEELPDHEGTAHTDILLEVSVEKHRFPSGLEHVGQLHKVSLEAWIRPDIRKQVIEQMKGKGSPGLAVVDPDYYNTKSTFHEDAMKCYAQHLRPKGACPDYNSEAKRLKPKTDPDRKEVGLSRVGTAQTIHLCSFCPVKTYYITKQREQANLYD